MSDDHGAVKPILNHELLGPHVIKNLIELMIMGNRKIIPERSNGLNAENPIEVHTVGYRTVKIVDLTGFYGESFCVPW